MNIFIHEMKSNWKSTMIWTISLMGIVVLFMSFFPTISKDIDQFVTLLEGFPEPVRQAFGIQLEGIGSILGFYAYIFMYITLCGAIQAMNLGISIVSKEVRDKTADFLLTKPVSRIKVLTAKLSAALVSLVITNLAYVITASIIVSQFKTEAYSIKILLMISMTLFFVQLIFLALGFLIAVVVPKINSVLTVSLGTVFGFFFIGMIASIGEDDAKRFLSPFKYFETDYIIKHSRYEAPFLITGLVIFIAALIVSFIVYRKKDIDSV